MENYPNQLPVDREISVNPSTNLLCKINAEGIIEYVNHAFSEISGYDEFEIIGESMDVLRHPDMPDLIYEILKERLEKKEPIQLLNKMLAKDGRYFWLLSNFETKVDDNEKIIAHFSHSVAAPSYTVHKINSLYKILSKIESRTGGTEVSKRYLIGFLEERNLSYNQFVEELSINQPEYEKPFQQQPAYTRRKDSQKKNVSSHAQAMTYNSNLDLDSLEKKESPAPKKQHKTAPRKKSFLKKVFGK